MTKTTTFSVKFSGNFDDYTGPIVSGNDLYRRAMATSPVLFPKYYMPDEIIHLLHIFYLVTQVMVITSIPMRK